MRIREAVTEALSGENGASVWRRWVNYDNLKDILDLARAGCSALDIEAISDAERTSQAVKEFSMPEFMNLALILLEAGRVIGRAEMKEKVN